MEVHEIAFNKAKIQLMARPDSAFFTAVLFSLRTIFDDSLPTAATDGKKIWINPKFFLSLDRDEQVFVLIHEAMHVAYMHMGRLQSRDMRRWNWACDYVINLQLVQRGFKMPSMGLLDYKYDGMSAEQVYDLLDGSELSDEYIDLKLPENPEELEEHVNDVLVRARIQSRAANDKPGTIPGDIEVYLDRLLNPKLPWQTILRKWFQARAKNDYYWNKPNRRYFPKHILPSLAGVKMINAAVAVDISGSVSDEEFERIASEVHGIMKTLRPDKITLLQFDTRIISVDILKNANDLMKVQFSGRGGTHIGPVMNWANKHRPELLLIFTDGGFYSHGASTKIPTVWLIHNNPNWTAPFGKVVHYEP